MIGWCITYLRSCDVDPGKPDTVCDGGLVSEAVHGAQTHGDVGAPLYLQKQRLTAESQLTTGDLKRASGGAMCDAGGSW